MSWQYIGAGQGGQLAGPPGPDINFDPPAAAGGTSLVQGLPDGSEVVRPLALFNAPGGVVDDAGVINESLARTGFVRLVRGPVGYTIYSPTLVPPGGILTGPPSAVNTAPTGPGTMPAVIRLANGANAHMVIIGGNNAYIGNLELDGNKAGQNSGFGNGILYQNWFFLVLERVFVHDQFFRGINAVSGTAARIVDCSIGNNRDVGIFLDGGSTDTTIRGTYVNNNAAEGIIAGGFVTRIEGCDIWNNAFSGVKVPSGGRAVMIANCGIDHNQQHGIVVQGPSVAITGNTLHSNGLQSNNGFNSITVDNSGGTVDSVDIAGNTFWLDGGVANKVAYHIAYSGTVVAKAHGNTFQAASSATGTISAASAVKDANETG